LYNNKINLLTFSSPNAMKKFVYFFLLFNFGKSGGHLRDPVSAIGTAYYEKEQGIMD
jgi:hypothetical protein